MIVSSFQISDELQMVLIDPERAAQAVEIRAFFDGFVSKQVIVPATICTFTLAEPAGSIRLLGVRLRVSGVSKSLNPGTYTLFSLRLKACIGGLL